VSKSRHIEGTISQFSFKHWAFVLVQRNSISVSGIIREGVPAYIANKMQKINKSDNHHLGTFLLCVTEAEHLT